jgi:hypothetical protein
MEVLLVGLQMFGQMIDTVAEDGNLNLGRAGVVVSQAISLNDLLFRLLIHFSSPFLKFISQIPSKRWVKSCQRVRYSLAPKAEKKVRSTL